MGGGGGGGGGSQILLGVRLRNLNKLKGTTKEQKNNI